MLTVERPCQPALSKATTTSVDLCTAARQRLRDARLARDKDRLTNVNECQRLCHLHKQRFNQQFDCYSNEKLPPSSANEQRDAYLPSIRTYAIPRIEHASALYRQAVPSFEIATVDAADVELSIVKELRENLDATNEPKQT